MLHPHIVTAYDAEESGDLQFLVMEYVEGDLAKRGAVSLDGISYFPKTNDHVNLSLISTFKKEGTLTSIRF